jgi:plastocyanin
MNPVSLARVLLLGSAALAGGACGADQAADRQTAAEPRVETGGRIHGVVQLRGSPPAAVFERISKDTAVCGSDVSVTRLSVDENNGVRHAFVYLENAPASEPPQARAAVALDQRGCEYLPRAMRVHAGTQLDISNGDPILHNVHARETTERGLRTIFNIAQPMQGQRTLVDLPLSKPGIVAVTCEAGHPWMTAYILVADHPYAAVTGEDGRFVIENVPSGTYRIRMWHEGVRLKNIFTTLQQYEYEEPYEITHEVVVPPAGEAEVNFDLELRGS